MLPEYFLVSETDGGLYDTRQPGWAYSPPLRHKYARFDRILRDSISLRAAIRQRYAWPGGYEIVFITRDGGVLCGDCVRKEYRQIAYSFRYKINDGWQVETVATEEELEGFTYCDHCGRTIVEDEIDEDEEYEV